MNQQQQHRGNEDCRELGILQLKIRKSTRQGGIQYRTADLTADVLSDVLVPYFRVNFLGMFIARAIVLEEEFLEPPQSLWFNRLIPTLNSRKVNIEQKGKHMLNKHTG